MIYISKDRQIHVVWSIFRGTSDVLEDFSRALVKVFLIGSYEKYLLEAVAEGGNLVFDIPLGLPEGAYSLEAIWVKNYNNLLPCSDTLTPSVDSGCRNQPLRWPFKHPHDHRFNDRCIMRSRKDFVFALTEYDSESTFYKDSGEAEIKIRSAVATYGYDGLSAYEIAVLRGDFNGTEGEYLDSLKFKLEVAQEHKLGGITAVTKTDDETEEVKVDPETGRLYVKPGGGGSLSVATETKLGGIKASSKTSLETQEVKIDPKTGKLYVPAGNSGTKNYVDLLNKPAINGVTLNGDKTALDYGLVGQDEFEQKQDKIKNVNISVTGYTGTPSGSASFSGGTLNITLKDIKGEKGDKGNTGPANNLSIGNVSISEDSYNANAEIIGDAPNQTLNLTIPRGLKGDSGVQLGDVTLTQEFGTNEGSEDKVVSQKAISYKFQEIDSILSISSDLSPDNLYPGMYLNADGIPTSTTTEGAMVKEYKYTSGYMYASGYSPSSPNVAVAYFNDDLLLGTQNFGQSVSFDKELLTIPSGTNKVRIMGNNHEGEINQPYAYLRNKANKIDDEISSTSINPVANKALYEQLTIDGLVELPIESSVSGRTVSSTDGSLQSSTSPNSIINEYSIDDSLTYYASGRIGVTVGTCMIAYYNNDSFISCEIISEGTGHNYLDYKMTVPSNANVCRIAGNSDYVSPVLKQLQERKYLKEKITELEGNALKVQFGVPDLSIEDESGNAVVVFYSGHIRTKNFDSNKIGESKKLNVLSIGNSYSRDCLSHVPYLLKNISANVEVCIGLLYYGGCSLQQHYDFVTNNNNVYEYCQFNPEEDKWSSIVSGKTIEYALQQKNWDIILFQQKSSDSIDYSTCQPYLNNLINWLYNRLGYNFRTGWIETHAYATGYSGLSSLEITSDEMAIKSAETSKLVLENTVVDFILPYGMAIQNARHTSLDSYANHLTYEGTHLNEGIATLIAGYTIAECLADRMGLQKSILGDPLRPTTEWQTEQNIPQPHGSVVGITNSNCFLGQRCAIMAIKNPYNITDLN